ncbi:hypothetical protein FZI91_22470 [Mycobacterium sp. CBMA271]|uniref:hypothetical protein n=1 Tax=unclassified Mycobacteroides TaxID=2618759 RepID=UPI00132AB7DC|nr:MULTISPECIES: hypothetical protein [unclassified Mycobacteroides]MUM15837.1 hypothetical protein [Mycobacteroides sp. CBMA 326]MUM24448.1 hypothetical protein [Mycobacteroides sp. CBMA 271]
MKSVVKVAAVAVAGAGFSLAAAGLAHAGGPSDTTGQLYADASSTLKGEGYSVVVAGRSGDQVSLDNCLVSHQEAFTVKKGQDDRGKMVHVTLRCYKAEVAAAKKAAEEKAKAAST